MTQDKALEILKSGVNVFLTGEPGAGKTYTINQYIKWARSQGKQIAITASTGIAATHIDGMTLHSFCGMGVKANLTDGDIEAIWRNEFKANQISRPDILIIDEISMLSAKTLDDVERIISYYGTARFGNTGAFGGKQVIFVGDFFQLPPVDASGKNKVKFAYESESWAAANPTVCYLDEQHRQDDAAYLDILTAMRSGLLDHTHLETLKKRNVWQPNNERTILFTHNADVDHINDAELAKIEGMVRHYAMESDGHDVAVSILKRQCLSPEILKLKVGARVMFTRNNWDTGYVNGTIGHVTEFLSDGSPVVTTHDGKEIVVLRAEWKFVNTHGKTTASLKQIPLRLAWAITVHKSQGMSLDEAHIDLSKAFEFGQGYVALSRVRSLAGLSLAGFNKKALQMHPKVVEQDKVFRELSGKVTV